MIIDKVILVTNIKKERVVVFTSYTLYQEWRIQKSNPCMKILLALKFSREREHEAKLERQFNLPVFSLRGALFCTSYSKIKQMLWEGRKRRVDTKRLLSTIKGIADPYDQIEPTPIHLPIRVIQPEGIWNFDSYDAYFQWKLEQHTFLKRQQLKRRDGKKRHAELIMSAKHNRSFGYYRGAFDIDYKNVLPQYYGATDPDYDMSSASSSFIRRPVTQL